MSENKIIDAFEALKQTEKVRQNFKDSPEMKRIFQNIHQAIAVGKTNCSVYIEDDLAPMVQTILLDYQYKVSIFRSPLVTNKQLMIDWSDNAAAEL